MKRADIARAIAAGPVQKRIRPSGGDRTVDEWRDMLSKYKGDAVVRFANGHAPDDTVVMVSDYYSDDEKTVWIDLDGHEDDDD